MAEHAIQHPTGLSISARPLLDPEPTHPVPLLSEQESNRLALIASVGHFAKGALVYRQGDPAENMYNVVKGVLKSYVQLEDGRQRILNFLFAQDLVGLAENGRYISTVQAITPVTTYNLPLPALEQMLRHDGALEYHFLSKVCHDLRDAQRHALLLTTHPVEQKLAKFLGMMLDHMPPTAIQAGHSGTEAVVHLSMTRADIADYLGLSFEAVSRAFAKLRRQGIIHCPNTRTVEITDAAAFQELAARNDAIKMA